MSASGPLELDGAGFAEAAAAVARRLAAFLDGLEGRPASIPAPDQAWLDRLAAPPGEAPAGGLERLLDVVLEAVGPGFDTAGPGYLAYIPGGGVPAAALAGLVADVTNRFAGLTAAAPGLAAIEHSVVRWLADVFDLPPTAGGDLTSGGSLSLLSAVVAARSQYLGDDPRGGRLYVSEQAHHAIAKAARVAGLAADAVRAVPTDGQLRLDPVALADAIDGDRAAGRRPFLVVGTAGTTNTGAVDPLEQLAEVAQSAGLWFHVDAAYGGFFHLTERGHRQLAGIGRADSITVDPHKGLFLPYGTGALVVRDVERLRAAFRSQGSYLRDLDDEGLPSFTDLGPELTRPARGLRLWLPLHLHGVAAFRQALDEKLDLAVGAHRRLADVDHLELPWSPPLSIVAFRHRDGDEATLRAVAAANRSGRVFLSTTTIGGRVHGRLAVLSFRTHADRVEEAVELLARAG